MPIPGAIAASRGLLNAQDLPNTSDAVNELLTGQRYNETTLQLIANALGPIIGEASQAGFQAIITEALADRMGKRDALREYLLSTAASNPAVAFRLAALANQYVNLAPWVVASGDDPILRDQLDVFMSRFGSDQFQTAYGRHLATDRSLTLSQDQHTAAHRAILGSSGLVDASFESRRAAILDDAGVATRLASEEEGTLQGVSLASLDVNRLIPLAAFEEPAVMQAWLSQHFTERELNEENLGAYRSEMSPRKFYSRIAGMLSLKVAIFNAANLALPGEAGSEGRSWHDVEYARASYVVPETRESRYRRERHFHGEVATALEGKGVIASFTDEDLTGMAIVVVESAPGASGIASLGLDISNIARWPGVNEARAHALGEAVFKATYFGKGQQAQYLANITDHIAVGESTGAGRNRVTLSGDTALENVGPLINTSSFGRGQRARHLDDITERIAVDESEADEYQNVGPLVNASFFRRGQRTAYLENITDHITVGASEAAGRNRVTLSGDTAVAADSMGVNSVEAAEYQHGNLMAALMVLRGEPGRINLEYTAGGHVYREGRQLPLVQAMADKDVNVIFQFPGQGAQPMEFLMGKYQSSPAAKAIIDRLLPVIFRVLNAQEQRDHGRNFRYTVKDLLAGKIPDDELMASRFAYPLIGLSQAVVIAEIKSVGYDFTKATAMIGHSQGQVAVLYALGLLSDEEFIWYLAESGLRQQAADPYYPPSDSTQSFADVVGAERGDRMAKLQAFTGKVSMLAVLGNISAVELEALIATVNAEMLARYPSSPSMGEGQGEGSPEEWVTLSLENIGPLDASFAYADRIPLHRGNAENNLNVSGTTDALKLLALKVMEGHEGDRKVIVPAITSAYHSEAMVPGLAAIWPLVAGKRLPDTLPVALISNYDGTRIDQLTGTVTVYGPDGTSYEVDAKIHRILTDLNTGAVHWPKVLATALNLADPTKPVVLAELSSDTTATGWAKRMLKTADGKPLVTMLSFGDTNARDDFALLTGNLGDRPLTTFEELRIAAEADRANAALRADIAAQYGQAIAPQVDSGRPFIDNDYTTPVAYLAGHSLAEDDFRHDFIGRAERVLNFARSATPEFHSEFLEGRGYDPSMPFVLAGMTGNNGADLISSMAAHRYLGFYAATTVGFNIKALRTQFDEINRLTQEKVAAREAAGETVDRSRPFYFGVNVINDPRKIEGTKKQIETIIQAIDDGVPINAVSVAFAGFILEDPSVWAELYQPLLDRNVAVVLLGAREKEWDAYLAQVYENIPEHQHHLFAIAPESAEGGGHNIAKDKPYIHESWGYQIGKRLLARNGLPVPYLMTGGQSTPLAISDAALVMANMDVRGGMQIGGIMQLALEANLPDHVKAIIAEAAAGQRGFVQGPSEWDKALNMVETSFARDLIAMGELTANVGETMVPRVEDGKPVLNPEGQPILESKENPIGDTIAAQLATIFLNEPLDQRQMLFAYWTDHKDDNAFNRGTHYPRLAEGGGWPEWLAADATSPETVAALANALAKMTPMEAIGLFKTYRTMAIMNPKCNPERVYVLGGPSIRAMGQALEAEGQDPKKYFDMPAAEIFKDLRARSLAKLTGLYEQAMAVEAMLAQGKTFTPVAIEDFDTIPGVEFMGSRSSEDGYAVHRFKLGENLAHAQWLGGLATAGYGPIADALLTEQIQGALGTSNPLHRALRPQLNDEVEIVRREEAGVLRLAAIRVYDDNGDLTLELKVRADQKGLHEIWYLPQKDDEESSVIARNVIPAEAGTHDNRSNLTFNYDVNDRFGKREVRQVPTYLDDTGATRSSLEDGLQAYQRLWTGEAGAYLPSLSDEAVAEETVTEDSVASWHSQIALTADRAGVSPTYALNVAWKSLMKATSPEAKIDFTHVLHTGQGFRVVRPIQVGDALTAKTRIAQIRTDSNGRWETSVTTVTNQRGELVGELETSFLSQEAHLPKAIEFQQAVPRALDISQYPVWPTSLETVYTREGDSAIEITRQDIDGYAIDLQWLHQDPRFAHRMDFKNRFGGDVIAQGWLIKHKVAHAIIDGYLGGDQSRWIGFAPDTMVTRPVPPGAKLDLIVERVALRGEREILQVRANLTGTDRLAFQGTAELRPLDYAAVFPGNASQSVGMAKELWNKGGIARQTLEEGAHALGGARGELILDLITDGASIPSRDRARRIRLHQAKTDKVLSRVTHSSPAVMITSMAYYRWAREQGMPAPELVSGHSLGQYVAAVVAGALDYEDAVRLVVLRGTLMEQYAPGTIASVAHTSAQGPIDRARLQGHLDAILATLPPTDGQNLELVQANVNKRDQIVISGHREAIAAAKVYFARLNEEPSTEETDRYVWTDLAANIAFHSPRLRAMEPHFREAIEATTIRDPQIPMSSIVTGGERITTAAAVREELVNLNHTNVDWLGSSSSFARDDIHNVVEYGPGTVIAGFSAKNLNNGAYCRSIEFTPDLAELLYKKVVAQPAAVVVAPTVAPSAPAPGVSTSVIPGTDLGSMLAALMAAGASSGSAGAAEPAPAPLGQWGQVGLDIAMSAAHVEMKDKAVDKVTASPLVVDPKIVATWKPRQVLWYTMAVAMASFDSRMKPAELLPAQKLGDREIDSTDLLNVIGPARQWLGIAVSPLESDTNGLEQKDFATMAKILARLAGKVDASGNIKDAEWDVEKMTPEELAAVQGSWAKGKTYREMLRDAGAANASDRVAKLVSDGKLKLDTGGVDKLLALVTPVGEAALGGLDDQITRMRAFKVPEKFMASTRLVIDFRVGLLQQAKPAWEQAKSAREEATRRAPAAGAGAGGLETLMAALMAGAAAAQPAAAVAQATVVAAPVVAAASRAIVGLLSDVVPVGFLQYDPVTGQFVDPNALKDPAAVATKAALIAEIGQRMYDLTQAQWPSRIHIPWGNVHENGATKTIYEIYVGVKNGTFDPDSEYGKAKMILTANQMDRQRISLALDFADTAERQGLDNVAAQMRALAALAEQSLAQGYLPQPIAWDVGRTRNGMSATQFVDQLEKQKAVDAATIADLRAALRGEISLVGKKVMIYGGTGTISLPTVKFFLQLGADVWITTRQTFGEVEAVARKVRDENALRGNNLRVAAEFAPNKSNIELLVEKQRELDWKPDIIINGMAVDDYGPITRSGAEWDELYVEWILSGSLDYAVGRYLNWYKSEPETSPTLYVHNQDSKNKRYAFGNDGGYPKAKASMPPGQFVGRKESEKLFYPDGRPMVVERSLDTGLIVEEDASKAKGVTAGFAGNTHRTNLETQSAQEGHAMTVFFADEFGPINVVIHNPAHGITDFGADPLYRPDMSDQDHSSEALRRADGNLGYAGAHLAGGIAGIAARARKLPDLAPTSKVVQPKPYSPLQDGMLRPPTDYAFTIEADDGESTVEEGIKDDAIYLVGVDMATAWGPDAVSTMTNLWEKRGQFVGEWPEHIGMYWAAKAYGLPVEGMSPGEVVQKWGAELYANMGPRLLVEKSGISGSKYPVWEPYTERELIPLETRSKIAEHSAHPRTDEAKAFRQRVGYYLQSGYTLQVFQRANPANASETEELVYAVKENAEKARLVNKEGGAKVWASLFPIDPVVVGAANKVVEAGGDHVWLSGMVASGSQRFLGRLPIAQTMLHGADNVFAVVSSGVANSALQREQQQVPITDKSPHPFSVVYGIGGAAAGRTAQDIYAATGGAFDLPHACDTGPCAIHENKKIFQERLSEVRRLRAEVERQKGEVAAKAELETAGEIAGYEVEAATEELAFTKTKLAEAEDKFRHTLVTVVTGDFAQTIETGTGFVTFGAMLDWATARAAGYPVDKEARSHDTGALGKFQAGTGFGGMLYMTGWMVKQTGALPLAELAAADTGTDGNPKELDTGKTRAHTGMGQQGQLKVFEAGMEEAAENDVEFEDILFLNSHSTATGSDRIQALSLLYGVTLRKLNAAVRVLAHAPRKAEREFPQFKAYLDSLGLNAKDLYALSQQKPKTTLELNGRQKVVQKLGFAIDKPAEMTMLQQLQALPRALRLELGISNAHFEGHLKAAGLGHTLGGTLVENVAAAFEAILGLTAPHPYLNNLIPETAQSPIMTTVSSVLDLKEIFGRRPNYATQPTVKRLIEEYSKFLASQVTAQQLDAAQIRQVLGFVKAMKKAPTLEQVRDFLSVSLRGQSSAVLSLRGQPAEAISSATAAQPTEAQTQWFYKFFNRAYHMRAYAWAQNSFGFNGLDGFNVHKVVQHLRFKTRAEAVEQFTKMIQTYVSAIALYRGRNDGKIPAINYYDQTFQPPVADYADLSAIHNHAEDYAKKIVNREFIDNAILNPYGYGKPQGEATISGSPAGGAGAGDGTTGTGDDADAVMVAGDGTLAIEGGTFYAHDPANFLRAAGLSEGDIQVIRTYLPEGEFTGERLELGAVAEALQLLAHQALAAKFVWAAMMGGEAISDMGSDGQDFNPGRPMAVAASYTQVSPPVASAAGAMSWDSATAARLGQLGDTLPLGVQQALYNQFGPDLLAAPFGMLEGVLRSTGNGGYAETLREALHRDATHHSAPHDRPTILH